MPERKQRVERWCWAGGIGKRRGLLAVWVSYAVLSSSAAVGEGPSANLSAPPGRHWGHPSLPIHRTSLARLSLNGSSTGRKTSIYALPTCRQTHLSNLLHLCSTFLRGKGSRYKTAGGHETAAAAQGQQ
ncbi:uncharacterized protein EI97DRAFT_95001 [Westerdykella ornata]|uniref:Secreted protein n=1 Tax=Westerdykella ornata TaxID=318751 RepID=A0A6A6JEM7_WESOR|nr:uncharacterized protein EI97DRAFT_95001 [Westerdykella ornata]KAF2274623.1 hypothetical protein EI97DRAFT_95001 [Westerdykella ornata]